MISQLNEPIAKLHRMTKTRIYKTHRNCMKNSTCEPSCRYWSSPVSLLAKN